jgi:hypothetical protein
MNKNKDEDSVAGALGISDKWEKKFTREIDEDLEKCEL